MVSGHETLTVLYDLQLCHAEIDVADAGAAKNRTNLTAPVKF
jgi:hypothetical protein